jgi:superfamily II DNA or RNA helicase
MKYVKPTQQHHFRITVGYDHATYKYVTKNRWDIFKDEPLTDVSGLCYLLRRIVNTDEQRIAAVRKLISEHPRVIIFYNFDYELEILRELGKELDIETAEWNGHKHQQIPDADNWIYLVQYTAGAEGWNCTTTNVIIFYSQNYSYKVAVQAAGRIDRRNTPYTDLYYYHIRSNSSIDVAIHQALSRKKNFNERGFDA